MKKNKIAFRPYQLTMVDKVTPVDARGVLAIKMGFGKTAIVLEAIRRKLEDNRNLRVLVVAPKRVAEETWPSEISKWSNFSDITYSLISGNASMRKLLMKFPVNVTIVSRDLVAWYVENTDDLYFDMIVMDELTSFKNHKSVRFKAMRKLCSLAPSVIGMTGTPTSNGFLDLWAQIYLIDGGARLGKYVTRYRNTYFRAHPYKAFTWEILPETKELISNKLADIMWGLDNEELLDLPEMLTIDIPVKHSSDVTDLYKQLKKERVFEFAHGDDTLSAISAAGLVNYLLQFSGGAMYSDTIDRDHHQLGANKMTLRPYEIVSEAKMEALDELIEELIGAGETVMIAYNYKHELDRIKSKYLGKYRLGLYTDKDVVNRWNNKEYDILIVHPASFGHGLNLQFGGNNIVWYSPTYSYELYEQLVKRLHRPGQTNTVCVYRLVSVGMIDEVIYYEALKTKQEDSKLLFNIINILLNVD